MATRKSTVSNFPISENQSASIKRIKNGFIVTKSGYVGKGKNQRYTEEQMFFAKNPLDTKGNVKFSGKK